MNKLFSAIAISTLLSSAAYAAGDCIGCTYVAPITAAEYGSEKIENVPVKQNPFDIGRMNESPIRGAGRIKVVHNEPAPDDSAAEITKARWLLQDNGYQCSIPGSRAGRR